MVQKHGTFKSLKCKLLANCCDVITFFFFFCKINFYNITIVLQVALFSYNSLTRCLLFHIQMFIL